MSKTSRKQTLYHSCKITTSKNCCFYCISKNTANCLVNSQWCRQPRIPVTVEVALEATVEVSFKFISSEWNHLHNHLKYLLKIVIISCKMGIQYQKRPKYITTFSSICPFVSVFQSHPGKKWQIILHIFLNWIFLFLNFLISDMQKIINWQLLTHYC